MEGVVIDYSLDPTGYLSGVGQVMAGNTGMQQSMSGVLTSSTMMQRAMSAITPARLGTAAITGFALAAASAQHSMAGLEAASTVTHVRVGKLASGIRQMARDMPIGGGANELVTQFTKMGVASEGSEAKIIKLATASAKLGGATGESAAGLADGLTALSRITGNTNLDPKRYEALGDSLTTVALKSGASATGILNLSKNIAPMANAAGIGATGVLGISSAFARLGEDGIGASTTVNKMLGDMNRAVREGGPEIMAYSNIVGKTAQEFTALFKANPTEAITQVTEAIASAGSAGPRQLEQIGIEGVRGQRQLQGVMATGGMRPGIADAVAAYGSGSTGEAAKHAFGGLNDSLGSLRDASTQLASSLGSPLLAPLTAFSKGLTGATGFFAKIAESGTAQKTLSVVGGLAGAALLGKALVGAAATVGIGRQAVTSGVSRGAAAGMAGGRGDTSSWMHKFGGQAGVLANSRVIDLSKWGGQRGYGLGGQLGHVIDPKTGDSVHVRDADKKSATYGQMIPKMRPTGNLERAAYFKAYGAGQAMGPMVPGLRGPLGQALHVGRQYLGNIATTYADSARQNLWNQTGDRGTNYVPRKDSFVASKGFKDAWAAAKAAPGATAGPEGMKAFHTSLTGLNANTMKTSTVMMALAKSAGQAAAMTASLARSGAGAAAAGIGAVGRGALGAGLGALHTGVGKSLAMFGGGAGLSLMAGMGAYSLYNKTQSENSDKSKAFSASDINETLNTYREQAGQATKAVSTIASTGADYAKSVAGLGKSMDDARRVTPEVMSAGKNTEGKRVRTYSGTAEQQAAQIAGLSVTGLTADDISNAAIDLARAPGATTESVQKIIDAIPKSAESTGSLTSLTGSGKDNSSAQISPVLSPRTLSASDKLTWDGAHQQAPSTDTEGTGWRGAAAGFQGWGRGSEMDQLNDNATGGWTKKLEFGVGGQMHQSTLKKEDDETLKGAVKTGAQRREAQGQTFGAEYAQQEQLTSYEAMMADAEKSGNAEAYSQLGKYISAALTGKEQNLSPEQLREHGGLTGALSAGDSDYAKRMALYNEDRAKQDGGVYTASQKQSIASKTLAQDDLAPTMSGFFDYRGAAEGSPQAASMASAILPSDLGLLDVAVKSMTGTAGSSAAALATLQGQAQAAAAGLQAGTPEYTQAVAVQQRAGAKKAYAEEELTPSQRMAVEIPRLADLATNRQNTDEGQAARQEGEQGLIGTRTQVMAQMTARIQAQFSANTQKRNATEDYTTSKDYASKDYTTQVMRTNRDFNTNRVNAEEDFQLQLTRSKEDYDTARLRTLRDFNISVEQSEEDARTSRKRANRDFDISERQAREDAATAKARALRDFNTQVRREVEDSMSSMFDPYTRIAAKSTWDVPNLLGNIKEQNDALDKQKAKLNEIRKAGVSQKTIDFLGLGKTENLQQLTNVADDIKTKGSLAGELNAATSKRSAATKALVDDPSNVSQRRSREDMNKGLKDSELDLTRSLKRGRVALNRGLADQFSDLSRTLTRGRKTVDKSMGDQAFDFERNLLRTNFSYEVSLKRSAKQLGVALFDMEFQQTTSIARQEAAFLLGMGRIDRALLDADKSVGQNWATLSDTYNRVIHGQSVKWGTVMTNDAKGLIDTVNNTLLPAIKALWTDNGFDMPKTAAPTPFRALMDSGKTQDYFHRAEGGSIPGSSPHSKADNIHVMATAGEFMQPVSTVDHYGVAGMEAIRQKRVPKEVINGYYDGGLITFGKELQKKGFAVGEHPAFGGVYPVHTPGSWHYRGGAIDVNKDNGHEKAEIDAILGLARKHNLRTIWQVAGHFDHAHFDIGKGPDMVGKGYAGGGKGGGTGKPGGAPDAHSLAVLKNIFDHAPKGDRFYTSLLDKFEASVTSALAKSITTGTAFGPTTANANSALGQKMAAARGWTGGNWSALNRLWTGESGWNNKAQNPTSTAYGIAQFLDTTWSGYGKKTADPAAQITAGMKYIADRYGDPAKALGKWNARSPHWYDQGGDLAPGTHLVHNGTGQTEKVLTADQWSAVSALLTREQGQSLSARAGAHMTVHHNEVITYDNRVDFSGAPITVLSADPDDMARQLEARAIRSRVSQTRGVRR